LATLRSAEFRKFYSTLHYSALHYTTVHYTTLHFKWKSIQFSRVKSTLCYKTRHNTTVRPGLSLDLSPRARDRHTGNSAVRQELGESRRESCIVSWVTRSTMRDRYVVPELPQPLVWVCDMQYVTGQWAGKWKTRNDSRDVVWVSESISRRSINRWRMRTVCQWVRCPLEVNPLTGGSWRTLRHCMPSLAMLGGSDTPGRHLSPARGR